MVAAYRENGVCCLYAAYTHMILETRRFERRQNMAHERSEYCHNLRADANTQQRTVYDPVVRTPRRRTYRHHQKFPATQRVTESPTRRAYRFAVYPRRIKCGDSKTRARTFIRVEGAISARRDSPCRFMFPGVKQRSLGITRGKEI